MLQVTRSLGCLQLDPISAVAPSHLIVLWNRLGDFNTSDLDRLLWSEKKLFEYWAHQASIVLMEDYPLYYYLMRGYPDVFLKSLGPVWQLRVKKWLSKNSDLRDYVLTELKRRGPLLSRQFEDRTRTKNRGFCWSSWSDVSRMLFHLFFKGEVMVAGRQGKQKLWDLSERFLPSWVSKKELAEQETEYEAVQRSLRALGIGTESELSWHFLRGRYRNLKETLKKLEAESKIQAVDITDGPVGKGQRYIHSQDIPLLGDLDSDTWEPRVLLLSPFDNLFCDRARTKLVFNFDYTIEIYTPRSKRKYGYYVLPILYGDEFIGRVDPLMDRKNEKLLIKAVYAEPHAPKGKDVSREIRDSVEQLSEFLGAKDAVYSRKVPKLWQSYLH
ncbi:MAG TPA: crosslink repair DNA glycosylase YcaQ family protein [Candidatus Bathyarchaeia archaeon]|nr:crosslink repair DNA glycosylase YcaQ family protein [Candidatus Bathyarchaeia archaeon]